MVESTVSFYLGLFSTFESLLGNYYYVPIVLRLLNKHMAFTILLGVMNANTDTPLPGRKEECADQSKSDITFIDN